MQDNKCKVCGEGAMYSLPVAKKEIIQVCLKHAKIYTIDKKGYYANTTDKRISGT